MAETSILHDLLDVAKNMHFIGLHICKCEVLLAYGGCKATDRIGFIVTHVRPCKTNQANS